MLQYAFNTNIVSMMGGCGMTYFGITKASTLSETFMRGSITRSSTTTKMYETM